MLRYAAATKRTPSPRLDVRLLVGKYWFVGPTEPMGCWKGPFSQSGRESIPQRCHTQLDPLVSVLYIIDSSLVKGKVVVMPGGRSMAGGGKAQEALRMLLLLLLQEALDAQIACQSSKLVEKVARKESYEKSQRATKRSDNQIDSRC